MASSLSEAKKLGVPRYYTGKPCKRGHLAERLASCGRCIECHSLQKRKWLQTPRGVIKKQEWDGTRYRRVRTATPLWADKKGINEFMALCPPGLHVDHIIPLAHDLVCGLHVVENLQYLTSEHNAAKGNKCDLTDLSDAICPVKF